MSRLLYLATLFALAYPALVHAQPGCAPRTTCCPQPSRLKAFQEKLSCLKPKLGLPFRNPECCSLRESLSLKKPCLQIIPRCRPLCSLKIPTCLETRSSEKPCVVTGPRTVMVPMAVRSNPCATPQKPCRFPCTTPACPTPSCGELIQIQNRLDRLAAQVEQNCRRLESLDLK